VQGLAIYSFGGAGVFLGTNHSSRISGNYLGLDAAGIERGTVVAVVANPADDLLELDGGSLVPVGFVVGWEGEGDARRLVIDPPAGLFDL
jgi:hypothetical protein